MIPKSKTLPKPRSDFRNANWKTVDENQDKTSGRITQFVEDFSSFTKFNLKYAKKNIFFLSFTLGWRH